MDFSVGILFGILLAIYILPIIETISQVVISQLNIYIAKNNLTSTEFAVKTQELVGKENCSTNAIGFQFNPKEEIDFGFEDEEYEEDE